MASIRKIIIAGLIMGFFGVTASLLPFVNNLEKNTGLDLLFKLRGKRTPPSEVIIVSLDKASAEKLQLPHDPEKWPRSLHAKLTKNLVQKGAALIVFDVMFYSPGPSKQDILFSNAIRKAGNVILCQCIHNEKYVLSDKNGTPKGELIIEKLVQPVASFERSALALAPFPLPKVPVKVNQYWTFKTETGGTPTLPVTVIQTFFIDAYDDLIRLIKIIDPSQANRFQCQKEEIIQNKQIEETMLVLRNTFRQNPKLGKRMLQELKTSEFIPSKKKKVLETLVKLYQGPDSRYLNFYGPPGSIKHVSYHRLLAHREGPEAVHTEPDLAAKVVFIGHTENIGLTQKDGFYTVFSQPSGIDISGVELAASAFANLLEGHHVRPFVFPLRQVIIFLWGVLLIFTCFYFPPIPAAMGVISVSILYFTLAVAQFKAFGNWLPVVVPIFFQAPAAFFGTMLWKYVQSNKERKNIRTTLEYLLPAKEVSRLLDEIVDIENNMRTVYGTCLYTDAEAYTAKTEEITPEETARLMKKYFATVFAPIHRHGGFVSDIKGDAVLAVWATPEPDISEKKKACLAAMEISKAISLCSNASDTLYLPTRIGLHSGFISLGSIGAMNRYEYRPIGDIVNTISRIESLNKYLGTNVLASESVVHDLDGIITRKLGNFLFVGKSKPTVIYELICRSEDFTKDQALLCHLFKLGRSAYSRRAWGQAIKAFNEVLSSCKEDGPSKFYLNLCEKYIINPPGKMWTNVIVLRSK